MNPFLGLDCGELCDVRLAIIDVARKGDLRERNAFEALFDAIEQAGDFLPMPVTVGDLTVEAVDPGPDDPTDRFEVSIVEHPRGKTGAEWSYTVVRFEFEIDDDVAIPVEAGTVWVHEGFGFGVEAPCSIYDAAYSEALTRARGLAAEAADAWLEMKHEARREAIAEERAEEIFAGRDY